MADFLLYIIKSCIYLTILYICIKTFLSNETFFRFNRWVLLLGVVLCTLLPFIKISTPEPSVIQHPYMVIKDVIIEGYKIGSQDKIDTELVEDDVLTNTNRDVFPISSIFFSVYIIGGIISALFLFRSFYMMWRLIKKGKKIKYFAYTIVISSADISPFSWRKYIIMSEKDYNKNQKEVFIHEMSHLKHCHSLDLIFMEFILLFQWFNPAVWLLKRELKDIHEYQADMGVLQSGIDATKYQLLLVKKAVGSSSYTLANSFITVKLKKGLL